MRSVKIELNDLDSSVFQDSNQGLKRQCLVSILINANWSASLLQMLLK